MASVNFDATSQTFSFTNHLLKFLDVIIDKDRKLYFVYWPKVLVEIENQLAKTEFLSTSLWQVGYR